MSERLKHFEIERRGTSGACGTGDVVWIEVGAIDMGGEYPSAREALAAWAGEQSQEPPLGRYRVIDPHGYLTEFDVSETRERVIDHVDRPATYSDGSTDATSEALDAVVDLAAMPGGDA